MAPRTTRRRRAALAAIYVAFLGLIALGGWRLLGWFQYGIPLTGQQDADVVWRHAYPVLWNSGVLEGDETPSRERFNVLLLGASVLEQAAPLFAERASREFMPPWTTYNVSLSAHTSRDSWLKYQRVRDLPFHLIVFYHGINDARMNCCPPGAFRLDYRHCGWYESLERRLEEGRINVVRAVKENLASSIPLGEPDPEWLEEGTRLKTPAAFRANLESIVRDASERKRRVALITFAFHLPAQYTREEFEQGRLDYGEGLYRLPVEVWGRPEAVRAAIDAHNAVLKEVAGQFPETTILIDMQSRMPRDGRYFSDPCHLTDAGVALWNDIVFRALRERSAE